MFSYDEEQFLKAKNFFVEVDESLKSMGDSFSLGTITDSEITSGISQLQSQMSGVCENVSFVIDEIKKVEDIIEYYNSISDSKINDKDSTLFDGISLSDIISNLYRSDQRDAFRLFNKYAHNDELTDSQKRNINTFLQLFNNYNVTDNRVIASLLNQSSRQGCGYSVVTNILVDLYKNKPDDFKEKFGYSLFQDDIDEKGRINYDCIFVDTFLKSNAESIIGLNNRQNGIFFTDYSVTFEEMGETLANVLGDTAEAVVQTCPNDISVETYEKAMSEGYDYAAIAVKNFDLMPYGDNPEVPVHNNGGHWMSVLGVSEEGNAIVSSWGYEWELQGGETENGENDGGLVFFDISK